MQRGREGGTWLAMNRDGRIGALLNVLKPLDEVNPGKKHRGESPTSFTRSLSSTLSSSTGFLVTDFVTSGLQGPDYLSQLTTRATDHAEFTMVTVDFKYVSSHG